MMKKKKYYTGIVLNDTNIMGLGGYYEEGCLVIDMALEMKRKDSIKQDTNKFVNRFSLEDYKMGAVCVGKAISKVTEVPYLSAKEVRHLAMYQIDDDIDLNDYVIDYFLRKIQGRDHLFMVAINRRGTYELASGLVDAGGALNLIDFWPSPIVHARNLPSTSIIGFEKEGLVELSFWRGTLRFKVVTCKKEEVLTTVEEIIKMYSEYIEEYLDGVMIYKENGEYSFEYDDVYEAYGMLDLVEYTLVGDAANANFKDTYFWDAAVGLLMREFKKSHVYK